MSKNKVLALYAIRPDYNKTIRFDPDEYKCLYFNKNDFVLIRNEVVDSKLLFNPREYEIAVGGIDIPVECNDVEVDIQYFKPSGKYYTTGITHMPSNTSMVDAVARLRICLEKGSLQG